MQMQRLKYRIKLHITNAEYMGLISHRNEGMSKIQITVIELN